MRSCLTKRLHFQLFFVHLLFSIQTKARREWKNATIERESCHFFSQYMNKRKKKIRIPLNSIKQWNLRTQKRRKRRSTPILSKRMCNGAAAAQRMRPMNRCIFGSDEMMYVRAVHETKRHWYTVFFAFVLLHIIQRKPAQIVRTHTHTIWVCFTTKEGSTGDRSTGAHTKDKK